MVLSISATTKPTSRVTKIYKARSIALAGFKVFTLYYHDGFYLFQCDLGSNGKGDVGARTPTPRLLTVTFGSIRIETVCISVERLVW